MDTDIQTGSNRTIMRTIFPVLQYLRFFLAALAIQLTAPALHAQEGQVNVAIVENNPPFSRIDHKGEARGLEIELVRKICTIAKWDCVFQPIQFENLIAQLQSEKVDLIAAGLFATDERKAVIDFATPHVKISLGLITKKDSLLSGFSKADLDGIKLGITSSTLAEDYAKQHFESAQIVAFDNRDAMFLAMANGTVDALTDDLPTVQNWLGRGDGRICCRFVAALPFDPKIIGDGISLAVRKKDPKLGILEEALGRLEAEGYLKELRARHLPFDS